MHGAILVSVKRRIPATFSFKIVQVKNVSLRKKKLFILSVRVYSTTDTAKYASKYMDFIFIVVPCILIILKFFSPTNAQFIKHIKC
jgi:hypothetical protein